jgi:hypothetical protein
MKNLLFVLIVPFIFSCKETAKPNPQLAGIYDVKMQIHDDLLQREEWKDSVRIALEEAKESLKDINIESDLELSQIDTTTAEGRIEYAAKNIVKEISGKNLPVEQIGTGIIQLAEGLLNGGLGIAKSILNHLSFQVELLPDGQIKGNDLALNTISAENAHWESTRDSFYLSDKENESKTGFYIKESDSKGFIITKEKVDFIFTRVKQNE